jgi:hypothetical protein
MITLDKLARAIETRLGHPADQARDEAHRILNYFGFRTRIIDNAIHPDDRKLFYALQDAGLLQSTWETVLLLSGRNWRIFYWELVESDVERGLRPEERAEEPLYKSLPDEAWGHTHAAT